MSAENQTPNPELEAAYNLVKNSFVNVGFSVGDIFQGDSGLSGVTKIHYALGDCRDLRIALESLKKAIEQNQQV